MDTKVKNDGKKERETETPFVPVKQISLQLQLSNQCMCFSKSLQNPLQSCHVQLQRISGIHATCNPKLGTFSAQISLQTFLLDDTFKSKSMPNAHEASRGGYFRWR